MADFLRRLAAGLAMAGLGLAQAGQGWGSGFQLRENSASALGNAFAGAAASTGDPSIIANNPAGMIGLSGNQVSGNISVAIPSAVFSGDGRTAARQPISGAMAAMRAALSGSPRPTASTTPHLI
jgi:long-chain fatty acid transport protein